MIRHCLNKKFIFYSVLVLIFIFGILIRVNWYLSDISFWFDELLLVLNLQEITIFDIFKPLNYNQSVPPLFLLIIKSLISVFGHSELIYRLFSIFCGILSIFVFYLFSLKFFRKNCLGIIVVNFLFAINYYTIYYTAEVKPYISDMLTYMCTFLILDKLSQNNKLHIIIASFIFAVLPWFSVPSLFILTSWFIMQAIYKKFSLKSLFIIGTSYCLSFIFYFFKILLPTRKLMLDNGWDNIWSTRIISDFYSAISVIKTNILYEFYPNTFVLLILILLIISWIYFIKEKNYYNNILTLSFGLSILFSFTSLYPFYQRLTLYCFPIILIVFAYPLEKISKKYIYILFIIIVLNGYNLKYLKNICFEYSSLRGNSKQIINVLKKNYNPNKDYIVINSYSTLSFYYYTKDLDINTQNITVLNSSKMPKNKFFEILNNLQKNTDYIFIKLHDTENLKDSEYLYFEDWIKDKNIILKTIDSNNFIYKIKL